MAEINFHALSPQRSRSGEDPLVPFLLNARGKPVTISVRDVARIDTLRLQMLLVAQEQWAQEAVDFQVTDVSPSFAAGLERLGLNPNQFELEATQ